MASGDSTEFLIEIATKLSGGDTAAATLAGLGDRMVKAGATAADLERTVKATAGAFEQSAAAIQASSSLLAAGETKYGEFEAAAERAAKAVERVGIQIVEQRKRLLAASDVDGEGGSDRASARAAAKLRELVDRQSEAAAKSQVAAAAMKAEAAALDTLRAKTAAASAAHTALSKDLKNVKESAVAVAAAEAKAAGSGKLNQIAAGLGKLGGPLAMAGQKAVSTAEGFEKLGAAMGSAGPYVAIAVAIVAVATAAAAATIAIAKWAVGLADANRSQGLLMAGVARSSAGGAQLTATIDKLGSIVPLTREELTGMAGNLADSGLRGDELSKSLETAAIKAAKLKFGPDFAAQMLSLDVQSKRFSENISATFGGLKIDPLLEGLQSLGALFDESTASGKAMKVIFETLFQPVIDAVAEAIPKVERFFLQGEILALRAFIALKPYKSEIQALGKLLLIASAVIVGVLLVAVVSVIAAVGVLLVVIGALAYDLYALGEAIVEGAVAAFDWLADAVDGMTDLGADMIQGLVDGITGAAGKVVEAMTGVVDGAIDAAKHALGIASRSKVLFGIGDNSASAFAEGIEGGTDDARGALEAMVAAPQGGGAAARQSGEARSITINITVEGRGETDDGLAAKIATAVRDLFETDAIMLGAGEGAT